MTQENSSAQASQPKLELVRDPKGILSIYCNNFHIGNTVFDLRLIFGELTDINEQRVEITQRVQVTMSWLEAKALAECLAVYVKSYEDSYGPIRTEFTPIQTPTLPQIPKIVPPSAQP